MATTEKMIAQMRKRALEIKVTSGKTPSERMDLLTKQMDLLNKSRVLREVIG